MIFCHAHWVSLCLTAFNIPFFWNFMVFFFIVCRLFTEILRNCWKCVKIGTTESLHNYEYALEKHTEKYVFAFDNERMIAINLKLKPGVCNNITLNVKELTTRRFNCQCLKRLPTIKFVLNFFLSLDSIFIIIQWIVVLRLYPLYR